MLAKKEKFSTEDILLTKKIKSKKIHTNIGFFNFYLDNPMLKNKKTIILSSKDFKTAVLRNYHKRLFYNIIRELKQKEEFKLNQVSFVFFAKKAFNKKELIEILNNINYV